MKRKAILVVWCLLLGVVGCCCRGRDEAARDAYDSRWTEWSNGIRMRVTPAKPIFATTDIPSFSVVFQAEKPSDVNIPYLIPAGEGSVAGPFTMLEVWVTNSRTGAKYRDELGRLGEGRRFSLVPEGSSLEHVSPGKDATAVFLLRGPFMPEQTVQALREAREKNLSIALDLLPKSLNRLPAGKYTLSVTIRPSPMQGRPDYVRKAMQNLPTEYRNVWTGTLTGEDIAFEISREDKTAEPPDARDG